MNRNTVEYARAAIGRLNARRTGRWSFDCWIDAAIRQWEDLIKELSAV
jgi:hypothetical protein